MGSVVKRVWYREQNGERCEDGRGIENRMGSGVKMVGV